MNAGFIRRCGAIAVGATLALSAMSAMAAWPNDKIIRLVVPFAAGGSTDLVARKLAEGLSKQLNGNVIVENRPGAGGTVGTDYVARQPADGYTILMGSVSTHGSAPCIYPKLPYDAGKDFTPLAVVATIPNVIVINKDVPAKNLQEFVQLLKKDPEKYTYASNGPGTSNHLASALFTNTAGVKMTHVPYRGSGPALIDLLGGQVNMMMDVVMTSYPYIKEGKIRALAVTSSQRNKLLPDVPTVAESGYPGFEAMVWFGMLAPAHLPTDIRDRLSKAIVDVQNGPSLKPYLEEQGAEVSSISNDAFASMIKSETEKWCKVVKQANIRLD
ncbi:MULTISPECIES: tripartite tricarboxylate transporter substrate binding protein [unclassified Achromobacter]|uniref:Bug family tripartite tricarboxylate transporter substrate binding protein n=1 Tax=unclassified Achromobacter TaxID=2626865 RepID=UPI000B51BE31|nr:MULTISPECIES: tripartite tricarboxylate transporter substrate binding protein [unclassified Achromobacter]OWT74572.1 ABC transporter substrate-binding protein [Achromobacter sp. HZ34]OWT79039.1 ABC transporter substrate-binding protein [Achromobacter sp. HZ28]